MNKKLFILTVFMLSLFSGSLLLAQPLSVQLQVGEEKGLGEKLGNCPTAGSYQVTPNLDSPLVFIDQEVTMSTIGVFAAFSVQAPFDATPGNYTGSILYDIFQFGGSLCFRDTVFLEIEVIPAFEPVPEFQTFPRIIVAGGTVDFENLTQNPVQDWLWDFGDGNTSTEQVPSNTYATPGKYTVSLTATGPGGSATMVKEEYIEVVEPGAPGQSIWRLETDGAVTSPAIDLDGTIYASLRTGLHAINTDGTEKWSSNLFISSPVIGGSGTIYGTYGGLLIAIDSSGTRRWQFDAGNGVISNGLFALGFDETAYIGTTAGQDGKLIAVDSTGSEKWSLDVVGKAYNPIIGPDGTIYVLTDSSSVSQVLAVTTEGAVKWSFEWTSVFDAESLSISPDGNIVVSGDPITVLDPDGEVVWEQSIAGNRIESELIFDQSGAMYGFGLSKIYSIDVENGDVNWTLDLHPILPETHPRTLSNLLLGSEGTIYGYSQAGLVFAITPEGEIKWQQMLVPDDFDPPNFTFDGTPALDTEGTLYIGLRASGLHAISTSSQGLLENVWSKRGQNNQNSRQFLCPFPSLIFPADQTEDLSTSTAFLWRPTLLADAYEIEVGLDSLFQEVVQLATVTDTSSQLELAYGDTYYWRVRSTQENGEANCWSATWRFSTQIAPPSSPTLISPADGAVDLPLAPSFSWSAATGAESYAIQVARDSAFTDLEKEESGLLDTMVEFLLPDYQTTYYWRVKAVNSTGDSDWSEIWRFETSLMTDVQALSANYNLRVFPNPAKEALFIEFVSNRSVKTDVWIYSATGQRISFFQQHVYEGNNRLEVSLSSLPPGIYLFRVMGVDLHLYGKFSKE